MTYNLTLAIAPVAKERARVTRFGAYTPGKTRRFETDAALLIKRAFKSPPLTGALKLTVKFIVPRPKRPKSAHPVVRPDLDNFMKAFKDAASGILWLDDSQVVQYGDATGKFYDMSGGLPRIEIQLETI